MNLHDIDVHAFTFINSDFQNRFFDSIMPFITSNAYLIFLPFFLWILYKEKKHALIMLGLAFASLIVADWLANELKLYFGRIRPCHLLDHVRLLVGCGNSFSFPSNHAVNAFAFAIPFYRAVRSRMRYIFLIIALIVGFSRIYTGVHYPSDVLAGMCFGIIISLAVLRTYTLASKRFPDKPHTTILMLSLAAFSLFRIYYILHGPLDLSPDEAHYWEWSRRLDLSYYSKGPLIAYLISIGTFMFGDTVFGIRVMAVIFTAASSILLYQLGKMLYDETVGLTSSLIFNIIPLFAAFGVIFTIDSPFMFFWICSLFFFLKAISCSLDACVNSKNANSREQLESIPPVRKSNHETVYWTLLGFSIGLGLLTKYTMALFYPCMVLFLLTTPALREVFSRKSLYLMLLLSIVTFSPVIAWNAQHDWVTFRHTLGQTHLDEGLTLSPLSLIEFFGSQIGVVTPFLVILMCFAIWQLRKSRKGAFLLWFSLPILMFFLLKSAHAKVQANWAMPGYITGIVAFSAWYIRGFGNAKRERKMLVIASVVLAFTVTAMGHYPAVLNLPVHMDPTARLRGWKSLGQEVSILYDQMKQSNHVFIFSDRYQISSELAFYVKGNPVTYCLNSGKRRMNQYDLWPGFNNLLHSDALFVKKGNRGVPEKIVNAFRQVEKRQYKAYTREHVLLREYSIFLCHDFKGLERKTPVTY